MHADSTLYLALKHSHNFHSVRAPVLWSRSWGALTMYGFFLDELGEQGLGGELENSAATAVPAVVAAISRSAVEIAVAVPD